MKTLSATPPTSTRGVLDEVQSTPRGPMAHPRLLVLALTLAMTAAWVLLMLVMALPGHPSTATALPVPLLVPGYSVDDLSVPGAGAGVVRAGRAKLALPVRGTSVMPAPRMTSAMPMPMPMTEPEPVRGRVVCPTPVTWSTPVMTPVRPASAGHPRAGEHPRAMAHALSVPFGKAAVRAVARAAAHAVPYAVPYAVPPQLGSPLVPQVLAVNDLPTIVTNLRTWVMGILAAVATLFLTIGGVRYVMAGGDPSEVERAKAAFKSAAIGYVLAVIAPVVLTVLKSIIGG